MNTFDSAEGSNGLKKAQFETELIDRFFNSKSYYLHGFMSYLRIAETTLEEPLDMVTVGLLVDEIINAKNKTEKLRQLERFEQFNFYKQQLSEGIKYLESAKLSTQQMMDIVGSLGKSFAETLINLISKSNSRNYLIEMVGLGNVTKESEAPKNIFAKHSPNIKEDPNRKNKASLREEPWDHFKKDVDKKIKDVQFSISQLEKKPDSWEVFKQIKNGYKDLRDWSMIHGDQGIEAISHKILLLFEAVYGKAPEKRNVIISILNDAINIIQTINNTGSGSEHLDIVRVMVHQIDKQREAYPDQIYKIHKEEQSSESFVESSSEEKHFDEESIKVENDEKNIPELTKENQTEENIEPEEIAPELPDNFVEFLQQDNGDEELPQEDSIGSFDQEFCEYLNEFNSQREGQVNSTEAFSESEQESSHEENNFEDLDSFNSINDSEMLSELVTDNADRLDEMDFPELEETDESNDDIFSMENEVLEDVTLPGEDDPELLDLISDMQTEKSNKSNLNLEPDIASTKEKIEAQNDGSSKPINENNADRFQESKKGNGSDFVEEADMYFSFAKKALQNLMKNSSDRQALEDMELACYSLKTIGDKLGYEQVGKMMSFAENFIQKRISVKEGLETAQINKLFSIVDEMEKAGTEKSYLLPDRKHWFSDQEQILKDWISVPSKSSKKNANMVFKNKQKKSASKPNHSEDPLDFLLFDDTSKYFKQLLKE